MHVHVCWGGGIEVLQLIRLFAPVQRIVLIMNNINTTESTMLCRAAGHAHVNAVEQPAAPRLRTHFCSACIDRPPQTDRNH